MAKSKKKQFSSYKKSEAFQSLNLQELQPWILDVPPAEPSPFFQERLTRLQQMFDLEGYEEAKKLLIDALCEEAMLPLTKLKIWKGAQLEGDAAAGYVDYLVAERKRYLDIPLLCIIEAKRDDFEKGLAQCLVEMQACQWQNARHDRSIDIYGATTNGNTWQFYCLTVAGQVRETPSYSIGDLALLLGRIRYVFELCTLSLS